MTESLSRLDWARKYLQRGYAPTPLPAGEKKPVIRGWTRLRLSEDDLPHHFSGTGNIGLLLGEPSGWLVDVDLDCEEAVELAEKFLPPTGAVTGRLSRPGSHWWYVCEGAKTTKHKDRSAGAMIVEMRSTGAQTVVGPSTHPSGEPYDPLDGDPAVVDASTLAAAVAALAEAVTEARHGRKETIASQPTSRGNERFPADHAMLRRAAAYLDRIPAAISGSGGHNQTYAAATAMVHGFCLDPETAFSLLWERYNARCLPPWSEKELRHKVTDAATKSHDRSRGWLLDANRDASPTVDISSLATPTTESDSVRPEACDPGLLPDDALRVPGFIGEVMDHCLASAPYPNTTLAFCGALALQAFLAGRKVRDAADVRTNLYLLGLAHSASGKDWPRKLNAKVLLSIGLAKHLGEQLASGEGTQDALFATPCMLVQTDEIDSLLQSIKRSRDARYESIMATLLSIFTSSNSIYPMRRRANNPDPGIIDQPCLVLFGTAIPNHYYAALTERMLTNGLFARMLVFEAGPRRAGQDPSILEPPHRVMETALWWAHYRPSPGNLTELHAAPSTVEYSSEAKRLMTELRIVADREYSEAEARSDAVATTVWGRVTENARKLALLYAVSEDHQSPEISADSVRWAARIVMHQARRMLFMVSNYSAESDFDDLTLRLLRKLREASGGALSHSHLLKRMKLDSTSFRQLIDTLVERGDLSIELVKTAGRDAVMYRLTGKGEER